MANASENRSTRNVIEDQLERRCDGDLEGDLRQNVDRDVVVLTSTGVYRGHDGVREQAQALSRYTLERRFNYRAVVVCGEVGYLEWTAQTRQAQIQDGADSFVVREGRIVAQTIHYIARSADGDRISRR